MEPITRTQLQNAYATAIAEKARIAHREQEIKGQLAAEEFYKEIRRVAEVGAMTSVASKSMQLGVAFDTLMHWTKEHFPDCDVSMEIRHMGPDATYGVRVSWAPLTDCESITHALEQRRLEKETSW
jgi:hypothetical protein